MTCVRTTYVALKCVFMSGIEGLMGRGLGNLPFFKKRNIHGMRFEKQGHGLWGWEPSDVRPSIRM